MNVFRTWIRNKIAKRENLFTFLWYLHLIKNENPEPVLPEKKRTAVWDGKDFAAIQTATWLLPRINGRPAAEVDEQWNLTVNGQQIPVSARITVLQKGKVTVMYTTNWFERLGETNE